MSYNAIQCHAAQCHTMSYAMSYTFGTVQLGLEPRPSKLLYFDVLITLVDLKFPEYQAPKVFKRKQSFLMRKSCDRSRGMTNLRNEAESQGIDTARRLYPVQYPAPTKSSTKDCLSRLTI